MEKKDFPLFNRTRKIILGVVSFFLLVGVAAQIPFFKRSNGIFGKVPEEISSEYPQEEGKYEEVGRIGQMEIAKVKEIKSPYWDAFGEWDSMSIDCWLIIGGIIICWLSKQNIMNNLVTGIQSSIPLLIIYIFAAVPVTVMSKSGMSENLANGILSSSVSANYLSWSLFLIFTLSLILSFFISSSVMSTTLVSAVAPALLAVSESGLIYAAIFAWLGAMLGMTFSPNNGILMASLEKSQITYKNFIKKTWGLGLTMLATTVGLLTYWVNFNIK